VGYSVFSIDNPSSYENRAVNRFLHAKNMSAAKIRCELCAAVCGQNVMNEGNVRQWCRMFKDVWENKRSR
jgi:hypothetical protein